jgi:hypothetical protein
VRRRRHKCEQERVRSREPSFRRGTPQGIDGFARIVARRALSPSSPRAYGATPGALGLDRSALPKRRGQHAIESRQMPSVPNCRAFGKGSARKKECLPRALALDPPHISPRLCRGILTPMPKGSSRASPCSSRLHKTGLTTLSGVAPIPRQSTILSTCMVSMWPAPRRR